MCPFRASRRICGRIPGEACGGQIEEVEHHQPPQQGVSEWPDNHIQECSFHIHWRTNETVPAREFQSEREIHGCSGAIQPSKKNRYVFEIVSRIYLYNNHVPWMYSETEEDDLEDDVELAPMNTAATKRSGRKRRMSSASRGGRRSSATSSPVRKRRRSQPESSSESNADSEEIAPRRRFTRSSKSKLNKFEHQQCCNTTYVLALVSQCTG